MRRERGAAARTRALCVLAASVLPASACVQPDCCSVPGIADLPGCTGDACTGVLAVAVALASSQTPDAASVTAACAQRAECVDAVFQNPVVAAVSGTTADALCAQAAPAPVPGSSCNVFGLLSLDGCGGPACDATVGLAGAMAGGQAPSTDQLTKACQLKTVCVDPIFASAAVAPFIPAGVTATSLCSSVSAGTEAPVVTQSPTTQQEATCRKDRGCKEFGCRSPPKGKTCQECWVEGARVKCPGGDSETDRIVAGSISGGAVFAVSAVAVAVCCLRRRASAYGTEPDTSSPPRATKAAEPPPHPEPDILLRYRDVLLRGMRLVGSVLAANRVPAVVIPLSAAIVFAAVGLPFAKLTSSSSKAGGLADWVPAGGRLEREVDYVDKWTDVLAQESYYFYVLVGPRQTGVNALHASYVEDMLTVLEEIHKIKVPIVDNNGTELQIGWEETCMSLDNPTLDQVLGAGMTKPCVNPGIMDCFFEGSWQFEDVHGAVPPVPRSSKSENLVTAVALAKQLLATPILTDYESKPSFRNMTQADIIARVSDQQNNCNHWSIPASLPRDKMFGGNVLANGSAVFASRLVSMSIQHTPLSNIRYKQYLKNLDEDELYRAMNDWYDRLMDRMHELDQDRVRFPDTTVSCYFSVSLKRMIDEVGRARVVQIAVGYGLMWVFLVVSQMSLTDQTSNHAWVGFVSFTFVIASNLGAFGFISLLGFEWNHAMLQALPFLALGLGVDDVFLLLHYFRGVDGKHRLATEVMADVMERGGASVGLTSLCNAGCFFCGAIIPIPALRAFLVSAGVIVIFNFVVTCTVLPALLAFECERVGRKEKPTVDANSWSAKLAPQQLVMRWYIPVMRDARTRAGLVVTFVVLLVFFSVSLATFAPLEFGTKITDLTPKGSYLAQGFEEMYGKVYRQHSNMVYIVTGRVDTPLRQTDLNTLYDRIIRSRWSAASAGDTEFFLYWLPLFHQSCARKGHLSTQNTTDVRDDVCDPAHFYQDYHDWRNPDPNIGGLNAMEAMFTESFGYMHGPENYTAGNKIMLATSQWGANMKLVTDDDGDPIPSKFLDHIDEVRQIMKDVIGNDVDAFPFGYEYIVTEEFVHLQVNFWVAFVVCICATIVAGLIVPVSWRGAPIIGLSAAATTIELMSVVALIGIKFNSTLSVTFLMSIGISIEFSAHVVVAFEGHPGSRQERLEHAAERTVIPVVEGAVSSFLGFSLLVGSDFPYVVKYFFWVYLFVVLIGLVHSMLFLPAILSFVGSGDSKVCCQTAEEKVHVQPAGVGPVDEQQPAAKTPPP